MITVCKIFTSTGVTRFTGGNAETTAEVARIAASIVQGRISEYLYSGYEKIDSKDVQVNTD